MRIDLRKRFSGKDNVFVDFQYFVYFIIYFNYFVFNYFYKYISFHFNNSNKNII